MARFTQGMETALKNGKVVLIEDVMEDLEASIDPVLQKAIYQNEQLKMIKFCDKDINYDDNFRLSITTKMPNPHYLPEICIKVTIINFTVTFEGLEEQMLVDVVM